MDFRELESFPDIDPSNKVPVADEEHEIWEFDFSPSKGLPDNEEVKSQVSISLFIVCEQLQWWF